MRTLICVFVLLMVCVVAVGFCRSWFTVSGPNRDGDANKVSIELSVDPDKVKADAAQAKDRVTEFSGKGHDEAK